MHFVLSLIFCNFGKFCRSHFSVYSKDVPGISLINNPRNFPLDDPPVVKPPPRPQPQKRRANHRPRNANNEKKMDRPNLKLGNLLSVWKGRFLVVCEQCYSLEPKIVKEMEISHGKGESPRTDAMTMLTKQIHVR